MHTVLSHLMYSVGILPVTILVVSNTRTLLSALVRPYPTCLTTFTSCSHAMLSYDNFKWERQVHLVKVKKGGTTRRPLSDTNI